MRDHDLEGEIINKYCQKFASGTVYKRNCAKYDESRFRKDLQSQPWENKEKEQNVEKAWTIFKGLLKSVMDKHAPLTKTKVQGCNYLWLTNEIRSKMNERDYWLRKRERQGRKRTGPHIVAYKIIQLKSSDTARQLSQDLYFKIILIDQSKLGRNFIEQNLQ